MPAQVQAVPLQIWLPANSLEKAAKEDSIVWAPATQIETQKKFLASDQFLESEPVVGRPLSPFLLSIKFAFQIKINFQEHSHFGFIIQQISMATIHICEKKLCACVSVRVVGRTSVAFKY